MHLITVIVLFAFLAAIYMQVICNVSRCNPSLFVFILRYTDVTSDKLNHAISFKCLEIYLYSNVIQSIQLRQGFIYRRCLVFFVLIDTLDDVCYVIN